MPDPEGQPCSLFPRDGLALQSLPHPISSDLVQSDQKRNLDAAASRAWMISRLCDGIRRAAQT